MKNAYGLVVGIANYSHVNVLPPSVLADARGVHEVLTNPRCCAYSRQNVDLLLDQQATRKHLVAALQKLAQRCNYESTAFFYISSHGHWIESGSGAGAYLLPFDSSNSSETSLARTAISSIQFTELLQSIPARKVVIIFDTCYSGGIGEPKDGKPKGTPEHKLRNIPESFYETLASGSGKVILSSSLSTEVSYVLPGAANSLFTQHLLAGLRGGVPGPGSVIRIFDLFHYLQPRVTRDCTHQHPFFKAAVGENFPIALYLGGKTADVTIYQNYVFPSVNSSKKAGNIMRQLDLLLGIDQKLIEHDRDVLLSALSFVAGAETQRKAAGGTPAKQLSLSDEAEQVVTGFESDPPAVDQFCKYPQTELLTALLRIGLRLDLRRNGMRSSELADQNSWTIDNWLSYLTDEIICERGLLRHHLIAPAEGWIEPLLGATALEMESLWQRLRSVLTRNGMSFAVSRPHFEIDRKLRASKRGLREISAAAKKAKDAWPEFPHLGQRPDFPSLEDLLPLPESVICSAVVFKGRPGCPMQLRVNGTIVAGSEDGSDIEYWPLEDGPVECVLESDEGVGFLPRIHSQLRRLYEMEEEILNAAEDHVEACLRLGLRNDLLKILWLPILAQEADSSELAGALHVLRDAWANCEELSQAHRTLLKRRDVYWDAMELIRKTML